MKKVKDPQERPAGNQRKREMTKDHKAVLWNLYAWARGQQRQGADHATIRDEITRVAGPLKIYGMAGLELALDIGNEPETRGEKLGGSLLQVGEGLTFGHVGEIGGAVMSALDGPGGLEYAGARESIEQKREAHREAFPKSSLAGEVAGSMLPVVAGGGIMAGRPAVGGVAQRAITGAATGAMGGAVGGAAYGHGAAEPGQRLLGTAVGGVAGGALGGALGAAMPVVAGGVRRLGLGALEQLPGGARVAQAARARFPARDLANAELRGALQGADIAPEALAPQMADMPPGSVVADLDPVLARQARAARNTAPALERTGGPVRKLQARHLHRGERMAEAIRRDTGIPEVADPDTILEAARTAWRADHLRPLQQANDEFGSMRLGKLLKDFPELKEYLRMNGQDMAKLKESGQLNFGSAWDALQDMKRSIGSPNMRSTARENLIDAVNAFEDMMVESIPEFADSQAAYAALSRRYDAYKLGNKMLPKPGAELRVNYERLKTPNERQAFREGLLDQIENKLREEATGGALAAQQIRDRAAERVQKLRVLFPSDDAFDAWQRTLMNEDRWAITNNFLQGNSTTAMQQTDMGLGGYVTTGRAALNEILSVIFEDPQIRREASEQVGQVLLAEGEEAAVALAMRLASQAKTQGGRAAVPLVTGASAGRTSVRMLPENE